ncbi:MAG: DUF692 domain-containing protein [Polyangiaceae bacterium]
MKRIEGVGLGLRWEFLTEFLEWGHRGVDFVEVSPENYMGRGGFFPHALASVRERVPVITHGLSMSLGGFDPLGDAYLAELRRFVAAVESPFHSDHLCFGSVDGVVLHDLLPLAFDEATVTRVADRVRRAQDALGVPMAVENISYYVAPGSSSMGEAEFVARVCDRADCGLMLDVNNAYVNATNHGFDVRTWLATVPLERVMEIHVAGHDAYDDPRDTTADPPRDPPRTLLVDTHGRDVNDAVQEHLSLVLERTGPVPVLLERDQAMPPLPELLAEVARLRKIYERATSAFAASRLPGAQKDATLGEVRQ